MNPGGNKGTVNNINGEIYEIIDGNELFGTSQVLVFVMIFEYRRPLIKKSLLFLIKMRKNSSVKRTNFLMESICLLKSPNHLFSKWLLWDTSTLPLGLSFIFFRQITG